MFSLEFWPFIGFLLAALAVMWNDSVQTLGTYMNSNRGVIKWWQLWLGASAVLAITIVYGWSINGGDISYGRLEKIPPVTVEWYHALAPIALLILTRFGIPVSTSFLVLSVFSTTVVLEKMFMKSFVGLTLAAAVAFGLWIILSCAVKQFLPKKLEFSSRFDRNARIAQALSTALLWAMWLTHDMSNIAVFLPRSVPIEILILVLVVLIGALGYIFWQNGGTIQRIVKTKTNTQFVIAATIVDLVYAGILYYFKILNSIPMSTTWVFVGILLGREVAIRMVLRNEKSHKLLPMIVSDLSKLMFGAFVSVALAFAVQGRLDDAVASIMALGRLLQFGIITTIVVTIWLVWKNIKAHHAAPITSAETTVQMP